jgi:hypothetical protein
VFRSVVSMSNPFYASPRLPLDTASRPPPARPAQHLQQDLAALPQPRKYYVWYLASRGANEDLWHPPQGVHDLLRAWYHVKSADWPGNRPVPLKARTATEMARMPAYYVMDLDKTVAETMAEVMPAPAQAAACRWMSEADLNVYSTEYTCTGFQGGLNLYRVLMDARYDSLDRAFAARRIEVPALFIGGAKDWGVRQTPGAFEGMGRACTRLLGAHLVEGAGHSIPEEQPAEVNRLLLSFLERTATPGGGRPRREPV